MTYQKFNTHDDKFHAEFTINTNVTESSVLYLNKEYHYPGGYHITLTVDGLKVVTGHMDSSPVSPSDAASKA